MNDQDIRTCECDCGEEIQDCDCRCVCEKTGKYVKPNRTTLKCGSHGSVTIPAATLTGTTFTLAVVNVNTKGYRGPCIKFDFAGSIAVTGAAITLNFQIFKQCKGQLVPVPVGPVWTFSRLIEVTESDSFRFFSCDCDICDDGCCVYSVVASVTGVLPDINETIGSTVINNVSLSAIIVDNM
ncbi:MAG: DUF4489 domain-containing protein [Lacrimispora sp.]|uniref:DUF4489 domain-containing protein n=1 Tax=Lacrimispora sp. TaxID=2719234 RepID=UPI0039E678D6